MNIDHIVIDKISMIKESKLMTVELTIRSGKEKIYFDNVKLSRPTGITMNKQFYVTQGGRDQTRQYALEDFKDCKELVHQAINEFLSYYLVL